MNKIKVAVIGAGGKMGTRTSNNLITHFSDKFDVKLVETYAPAVERIEKERGLSVTLSAEYVPLLRPGTVFLILDPAAAVAKELTLRDDCTFGVAHPCHPSYFKWQKEEDAYRDRFGGEGGHQDIVMSKICGDDTKFELAQETARCMYRADKAYIMTSEQIAFLEPTLVEILGASTLYAMAETVDEAVRRGIDREAAVSFLTGHIFNLSANFLGYLPGNPPVSDACKVAIGIGNRHVLRDDWKKIWEDNMLEKAIATMLHPDNPQL